MKHFQFLLFYFIIYINGTNIIVINTKLIYTWNRKNHQYHLNSRGILSTIVALGEENDSRTFYPLFTNNVT